MVPWWLRGWSICLQCRRPGFDPWVRKITWRRKWQHTPVFLPREFCGQRSLVGYSPWGHKESDTTSVVLWTFCTIIIVKVIVAQSCPTLFNHMNCSSPGSFVHGILQARTLEWVAFPFSRGLSDPRIKPKSPELQADFLPLEPHQRSPMMLIRWCYFKSSQPALQGTYTSYITLLGTDNMGVYKTDLCPALREFTVNLVPKLRKIK